MTIRESFLSRGRPPQGLIKAGDDPTQDFEYSLYNDWLRIKEKKSPNEFIMKTNWGPDIIIKIIGYK